MPTHGYAPLNIPGPAAGWLTPTQPNGDTSPRIAPVLPSTPLFDHWRVYRAETADGAPAPVWAPILDVSGPIPANVGFWDDTGAPMDGSALYYWAIAFSADESLGGYCAVSSLLEGLAPTNYAPFNWDGFVNSYPTPQLFTPALGVPSQLTNWVKGTMWACPVVNVTHSNFDNNGATNCATEIVITPTVGAASNFDLTIGFPGALAVGGRDAPPTLTQTSTGPNFHGANTPAGTAPFTFNMAIAESQSQPGTGAIESAGNISSLLILWTFENASGGPGGGYVLGQPIDTSAAPLALTLPHSTPLPCTPCCFTTQPMCSPSPIPKVHT